MRCRVARQARRATTRRSEPDLRPHGRVTAGRLHFAAPMPASRALVRLAVVLLAAAPACELFEEAPGADIRELIRARELGLPPPTENFLEEEAEEENAGKRI